MSARSIIMWHGSSVFTPEEEMPSVSLSISSGLPFLFVSFSSLP